MKSARGRLFLGFTLIMILCWVFFGITVLGGPTTILINDTGNQASSWKMIDDEIYSVSSLSNGPSSGSGGSGSFYYFRDTSNDGDKRHVADARVERSVNLSGNQKILGELGQLRVDFSLDYQGCADNPDWFRVYLYAQNSNGSWTNIWGSGVYKGIKGWKTLSMKDTQLPVGTKAIKIDIYADRQGGKDLDVYLDNIKLSVHDDFLPAMTGAEVTEIKDYKNDIIPLKINQSTGQYLDNWVNGQDKIYGQIKHNEPVKVESSTSRLQTNLIYNTGIINHPSIWYEDTSSFLSSHRFAIGLAYSDGLKEGESTIKFVDSTYGSGPFIHQICDLGGNTGQNNKVSDNLELNLGKYNLKLDNVCPIITTPTNSYGNYISGRTSVDIVVKEEDKGVLQSPLNLTYFWRYKNSSEVMLDEPEKEIIISDAIVPIKDGASTTYTVRIDIPNGSGIPPYQDFYLIVKAQDEARNKAFSGSSVVYKVCQKDATPPVITWDKSIHADGSEVNLALEEDLGYTTSRTVSFSANDIESGVEEIKYLWTKDPYPLHYTDKTPKILLPRDDGKYVIEGTSLDVPLEGEYYLNILAANKTETSCIISKTFNFDNEAPRVNGSISDVDGNPASAQYQAEDRALQSKFLYTILMMDEDSWRYEEVIEPDITGGIKDSGMWKALELDSIKGTASITGVLDKITQSGDYKLVTRFYDEYFNWTETEIIMMYDFDPPTIKIIDLGEPGVFKKRHEVSPDFLPGILLPGVVIELNDMSGVDIWSENFSINWVDAISGEEIPASIENPQGWVVIKGSDSLSGRYYLNVKAKDYVGNAMDEMVFLDGNPVEFCFDNSSPEVNLVYYNGKIAKEIGFAYSELRDEYTDIALFQYGISDSPDSEPSEWIDIDKTLSEREVIYPYELAEDGEWYLHIMLEDELGNGQVICSPEPFRIDVTKPSGSIAFTGEYTNKLDSALQLEIDELKTEPNKTFKTILSDDKTMLEDSAIGEVQPTEWKDITYEKGLAVYNWRLYDTDDGEQQVFARFMDEAGNISEIYKAAIILDRTAPTGEVTYDIKEPTSGNVTANLTMHDNYNATLLNNGGVSSYIFNRNGEFEFVLMDDAGNKTRIKAVVDNIDKDPPKAYVAYSHLRDIWTNESITATLHLEDINGYTVLGDGEFTHTFDGNDEFVFLFEDTLGNRGSIKAEVKNIDKEAPVGRIIYAGGDTAPVTAYLDTDESVKVTNNEVSLRYIFNENGTFTFEFEDKAGNAGTAVASVYTITSPEKYVDVIYNDSGRLTNNNIDVEFTAFSGLSCITSPTVAEEVYSYTHRFSENGDLPVFVRVFSEEGEGSIRTVVGSVYNIDRTSPEADLYISTIELTNQEVTATLLPYDNRGKEVTITNNGGKPEYTFDKNGSFTFEFTDEAGNIGYKTVTVSNIDKSIPIAEISYDESSTNSIYAKIFFPEETEVEILNNNGSDTFEFVENGSFTFKYSDKAGNEGNATAKVDGFPGSILSGTIKYYAGEIEIPDPNVGITNKDVTAKLTLDAAGGPYTIVNNGGRDSYTFMQNGEFTFVYEDSKKNRGFASVKVSIIDKEAPKLQILADIVKATNKDVIITVSYSDNKGIADVRHNMEPENITSTEGKITYICKENKEIQVKIIDTAGNETTKEFIVNYIDKVMPEGTIVYIPNSLTNKNVKAVLTINEPGRIINNSGRMEYIFAENGDFTFEFEDNAGNRSSKIASVDWIDKTPPMATLEYSNTSMTNKPVVVTVKADKDFVVLNNGGAAKRTFYTNGEYTFKIRDIAGNIVEVKAEVSNIDTEKPQITLKGSSYISIFENEAYIEPGYTAIDNIDGNVTSKVIVEGNVDIEVPGIYVLKYKVSDEVGNSAEVSRTVKVLGSNEIVLLLNGIVAEGESILIEGSNVKASVIGYEGSYIIKWELGKKTQAYFKSFGNKIAANETVTLESSNWYTFYIQDRERRTKSIHVYLTNE
ncbi:MAG: DUF5011 domain-containing protein [Lutispora sp.]|nr:DUF5011 domain-containing protein [Lutispora sp.]